MVVVGLVIALVISSESPAEKAWHAFVAEVRQSDVVPYNLKSPDEADTQLAIGIVATASEMDLYGERGLVDGTGSQACMWGRVTSGEGQTLSLYVYLTVESGAWKVRDLSLRRKCDNHKSPRWFDLR